jgi:hypothetical protein
MSGRDRLHCIRYHRPRPPNGLYGRAHRHVEKSGLYLSLVPEDGPAHDRGHAPCFVRALEARVEPWVIDDETVAQIRVPFRDFDLVLGLDHGRGRGRVHAHAPALVPPLWPFPPSHRVPSGCPETAAVSFQANPCDGTRSDRVSAFGYVGEHY